MKLLQIDSSARSSSVTRQLTAKFVEEWKKNHPAGEIIRRDLPTTLLPHITDDWGGDTPRTVSADSCAAELPIYV